MVFLVFDIGSSASKQLGMQDMWLHPVMKIFSIILAILKNIWANAGTNNISYFSLH